MARIDRRDEWLDQALTHAAEALQTDPSLTVRRAEDVLRVVPDHLGARLFLGAARRLTGDIDAALAVLEPLADAAPGWGLSHYELGMAYGAAARGSEALAALQRAVDLDPTLADAWRALVEHLYATEQWQAADAAVARALAEWAETVPPLRDAARALCAGHMAAAEALLRTHIRRQPRDPAGHRLLAEVTTRMGRLPESELILRKCLDLAPEFAAARHQLAMVLHRQSRNPEALSEIERLTEAAPRSPAFCSLKAAILVRLGELRGAVELYRELLAQYADQPRLLVSYGNVLRALGDRAACIEAFQRSIELAPFFGEAYWSLADLKTYRFRPQEKAAMREQLNRTDIGQEDRAHLLFASAKALEDDDRTADAFEHYAAANRMRRARVPYDAELSAAHVRRCKTTLTASLFADRQGAGAPASDPIFIIGMPRSGSTLVEQILASHTAVEGTGELPEISLIARTLDAHGPDPKPSRYPEILHHLEPHELRALGETYLSRTSFRRKTKAPNFVDKAPNNFAHVGLIHLILPNARIIDVRRHPLACCFSIFRQNFSRGQNFAYSLEDIGRYYRDYVELMEHIDRVLPDRVYRLEYESLVTNTEVEVQRLLQFCNLAPEDSCLRFFENDRPVTTASSEQVRRPIVDHDLDRWRSYGQWLAPLESALGPLASDYPAVNAGGR